VDDCGQDDKGARGRLLSALAWDGCRDYAALLSIPVGMHMWSVLGERAGTNTPHKPAVAPTALYTDGTREAFADAVQEGMARSRAYMRNLLHDQVVPMLMHEWGLSERDFAGPLSMRTESPMVLVSCYFCDRLRTDHFFLRYSSFLQQVTVYIVTR
jgi:hypothetical protein